MSEYLSFWPKAAVSAYLSAAPGTEYVYTKALPTNGFTEVVVQVECDAKISHDAGSQIIVTPQISNDGVNWEELTADAFTAITQASSYPTKEMKKITTIAAFTRLKIALNEGALGAAGIISGTIMITGTGRS